MTVQLERLLRFQKDFIAATELVARAYRKITIGGPEFSVLYCWHCLGGSQWDFAEVISQVLMNHGFDLGKIAEHLNRNRTRAVVWYDGKSTLFAVDCDRHQNPVSLYDIMAAAAEQIT
jgi:hypothetical protein